MQIYELLGIEEHNIVPPQRWSFPDLKNSIHIGNIGLKDGNPAEVMLIGDISTQSIFAAIRNNKLLGYIGFLKVTGRDNLWMAKQAESFYKGQGVFFNLLSFAIKYLKGRIISDYEMLSDGEKAWQSIVKKNLLNIKIYNIEDDKTYDINDPSATKPEDDVDSNGFIEWYHLIENAKIRRFFINEIGPLFTEYYRPKGNDLGI